MTQDGWAAWLGVGRATVQRWENGEAVPGHAAVTAIIDTCRDKGLFRAYSRGPLAGQTLTADRLRVLLAEARAGRDDAPPDLPARAAPAPANTTLPQILTSFVGRQQELSDIRRRLDETRLLTLTGTAGIGKSRLGLAIAREAEDRFAMVRLVELAPLTAPALVPDAIATAAGVREEPGRPVLDSVVDALQNTTGLIVLDNCEHLLAACAAAVRALLHGCPGLRVLATSREPLGVAGEIAWRVPPMSLPSSPEATRGTVDAPGGREPATALEQSDAVRLFVERARAVRRDFAPDAAGTKTVSEICRRLDGVPLAIELAAARVNVLAVEQIAARLDDRFRLLRGQAQDAVPRQQTLRAALDWSYDLLSEPERALLRRLAVVAGGCHVEAAEAICSGDGVHADEMLDILASLVDKSLLTVDTAHGEARYHLLETMRRYALEKLEQRPDEAAAYHRQHRNWYLQLAERAAPELRGPDQARWFDRLEREHDNLRAALEWSLATPGEATEALRLAARLSHFWYARGHQSEGRRWLEAALARDGAPAALRATALDGAGVLAHSQGDYAAARAFHEQSLRLWRSLDDPRGLATCLNAIAVVAIAEENFDAAEQALEESIDRWRGLGDDARIAIALNNLGILALGRGEFHRAEAFYGESLAIKRRRQDTQGVAVSLNNLGEVARYQGEYSRAEMLLAESLALSRELGGRQRIAQTLHSLGMVQLQHGAAAEAARRLDESLDLFRRLDDQLGMVQCIEGIAAIAAAGAAHGIAARLLGAAEAARARLGSPIPLVDRPAYDQAVDATRAGLDATAIAAAWTVGSTLALSDAADEAAEAARMLTGNARAR